MRIFSLILLGTVLLAGCRKDPPDPPGKAMLTEPAKNSECIPVQNPTGSTSVVSFSWRPSDHTDVYELRVTDLIMNTVQKKSTTKMAETLPLQKGRPFSWRVVSKNSQTSFNTTSETWSFYNPGVQTSHVPFPAEIISPESGTTVYEDINNEITLRWSATDIDNDIENYQIYFSTESPPNALIASLGANETSQKVSVVSGTVYYWKVVASDALGNASDTGVLDFKVY